ncbi:MAG: AraC family transcriptional regulator [Pseudomonadota bacterium]
MSEASAAIDVSWRSALTFSVCLPIVIIAMMLLARRIERTANRWLAGFLLVAAMAQIPQIIGFAGFYAVWPGLTFAPFALELFAGPFLYLHAHSLMRGQSPSWHKWLLLPGGIQLLYYLWAFLTLGDYKAKWAYNDAVHVPYIMPVETLLNIALIVFAAVAVYRLVRQYRQFLQQTQSAALDFDPSWLTQLIVAIVAGGGLFSAIELAPYLFEDVSYIDEYPLQIALTIVVAWIGFQALAKTTVTFPKMTTAPAAEESNGASDKDWQQESTVLEAAVVDGAWFLESRLSIGEVASRLATNETYVSRAVNKGRGQTFNAFINSLRVTHAKTLLLAGEQPLLQIAAASGFNSKATFNRVFRDSVGMTPTQFKRSQKSQNP